MYIFIRKIVKYFFHPILNKERFGTENQSTREKWLEQTLKKIPEGSKILDAGSGNTNKKRFCSHLEYISQDFAEYNGIEEKEGIQKGPVDYSDVNIISDISNIPVEGGSFDSVLCVEVIEHIPNPILAIKEFQRIIRPGGHLILTAPFNSLTHYAPYHYSTGFSKYYYEKHLPENGFEILEITPNGDFFDFLSQEIRRINDVVETYGNKKYSGIFLSLLKYLIIKYLKRFSDESKNSSEICK